MWFLQASKVRISLAWSQCRKVGGNVGGINAGDAGGNRRAALALSRSSWQTQAQAIRPRKTFTACTNGGLKTIYHTDASRR